MKFLRNAVVVIVGLLAVALVTLLLLAPDTIQGVFATLHTDVSLPLRLAVMLVLNALILLGVYLRLRRREPAVEGLIVQSQGAAANVEIESAQAMILSVVRQVPDVTTADATIQAVHGRADVQLDVTLSGRTVNIPDKQKEIDRALRQVIGKQLGLRLRGRPRVHIRLEPNTPVSVVPARPVQPKTEVQPATENAGIQPLTQLKDEPEQSPETQDEDTVRLPQVSSVTQPDSAPVKGENSAADEAAASDKVSDDWLNAYLRGDSGKDESRSADK